MTSKGLNGSQIKLIAAIAMTIDHFTSVVYPGYPKDFRIILMHIFGRLSAPVFWFFVAEGYIHTHNLRKYAGRMFLFSVISHFAYNFAFGISIIPFKNSVFNQTSVIWPLAWGIVGLAVNDSDKLTQSQKIILILIILSVTFCADWSCIAVLAIMYIGANRGNFRKQMTMMMVWTAVYATVYAFFIDTVYGIIQVFACLSIPLLKEYNGERGGRYENRWLFYVYYPAHLVLCGAIRLALHGTAGVMVGG